MQHDQFQLHADVEDRHWWFVARRRILARLVEEVLPPDPDATVIDVGCGTGANIAALADGYRCLGIDTSSKAIELARSRFSGSGVEFRVGRAPQDLGDVISERVLKMGATAGLSSSACANAPENTAGQASSGTHTITSNQFQNTLSDARLIMLTDVLEHIADDYEMFSELFAAAPPGCFFLITVPADESLWSEHDESFGHYRRYDLARLEGVWTGLPATTLMASYFNTRLLPIVRLVRASSRRRGHAAGRAGTDFQVPIRPLNAILTKNLRRRGESPDSGPSRPKARLSRRREPHCPAPPGAGPDDRPHEARRPAV